MSFDEAPIPWSRPWWVRACLAALVCLAAREALVGFFGVWFKSIGMFYSLTGDRAAWAYALRLVGGLLVGGGAWRAYLSQPQGRAWQAWGMALLMFAVPMTARHLRDTATSGVLNYGMVMPRDMSPSFPYRANTSHWDQEGRVRAEAHIDGKGRRVCGDNPADAKTRVAMIGDSWVYGKAVPDDEAPCGALRTRLDAAGRRDIALMNLGQAGANVFSYVDTLDWLARTDRPDVATMGLLLPNDAEFIDVNDDYWLIRHPLFRFISALLEPELAFTGGRVFSKTYVAAGFYPLATSVGLERLDQVATAQGMTVLLYLQNDQITAPPTPDLLSYAAMVKARFEGHAHVRYVGITPTVPVEPGVVYKLDQGHPTAAAYAVHMDWLRDVVLSHVDGRP